MSAMLVREIAKANIMIFTEKPKESRDYSGRRLVRSASVQGLIGLGECITVPPCIARIDADTSDAHDKTSPQNRIISTSTAPYQIVCRIGALNYLFWSFPLRVRAYICILEQNTNKKTVYRWKLKDSFMKRPRR